MQNKNPVISTLKGLAIILVVYGHVVQRSMAPNGADFFLNPAFKIIYTFHMPLFVFISGYLVAMSLSRKDEWGVFKSRVASLFVPFLCWVLLGVFTNYALNILDGRQSGIAGFPADLLDQLLVNPSVWFLITLFAMSCLLLCSVALEKRWGGGAYAIVYFLLMIIPYNNYFALYYIKWFYLFYLSGYFVSKLDIKITNQFLQVCAVTCALIIFVVLIPYWTTDDYIYINKMHLISGQYIGYVARLIYRYAIGFSGILIASYVAKFLSKTRTEPFWRSVGIYSLDIYLIQRYLVEGIYPRVVNGLHLSLDYNSPAFLCFFVPAASLLFAGSCILISKLLIRKNLFLNKVLLGNRN